MQEVRGLNDHRVHRVRDLTDDIRQVRARFSDERWAEFKQDMRFFMDLQGPEYLSTLTDHGANATPVWVFFARMLLGHASASEGLLIAAGLVDAVLLLLMALAMWRAFGLWPMLLAMTVFGANDLYMFGTNWTGATLRHDWLAMLGFGAAALKRERWTLGGICLALSALIRAFPVVALLGVCLPALWSFVERWRADRRAPSLKSWLADHPETVRVVASAAVTVVGMVLLTGALYGFASWGRWLQKVTLLNRDVGVNEISLRALVAGADATAGVVFQARLVLFIALEIGCIGVVIWLARRRPLHQAMVLSVPLVLVISNPSNYYSHFVFVLALMADVRRVGPSVVLDPRGGVVEDRAAARPVPAGRAAAARAVHRGVLGRPGSRSRSSLPGRDHAAVRGARLAVRDVPARRPAHGRGASGRRPGRRARTRLTPRAATLAERGRQRVQAGTRPAEVTRGNGRLGNGNAGLAPRTDAPSARGGSRRSVGGTPRHVGDGLLFDSDALKTSERHPLARTRVRDRRSVDRVRDVHAGPGRHEVDVPGPSVTLA